MTAVIGVNCVESTKDCRDEGIPGKAEGEEMPQSSLWLGTPLT